MVVADVDVEDVHGPVELAAFVVQILEYGIEAALLAGDDDVGDAGFGPRVPLILGVLEARLAWHPVLEALGEAFDVEVAAQHVQKAVVRVQRRVLRGELVVDGAVRGAIEMVDVGLVDRWAGQAHEGASAKGDGGQIGRRELQVCFHGAGGVSRVFAATCKEAYRFWLLAQTVQNFSLNWSSGTVAGFAGAEASLAPSMPAG